MRRREHLVDGFPEVRLERTSVAGRCEPAPKGRLASSVMDYRFPPLLVTLTRLLESDRGTSPNPRHAARSRRRSVLAGPPCSSSPRLSKRPILRRPRPAGRGERIHGGASAPTQPATPECELVLPSVCAERRSESGGQPLAMPLLLSASLGYCWNRARHEGDDEPRGARPRGSGRDRQIDTEAHSVKVAGR